MIRKNLDQAAKKSTIKRLGGRGHSPLAKRQERRGNIPLTKGHGGRRHSLQTKRQEERGDSPLIFRKKGRGYSLQKDKGNLGGNKLKSYLLRSRFPSKTKFWKKYRAVFCHHQNLCSLSISFVLAQTSADTSKFSRYFKIQQILQNQRHP